ncbi:MAG: ABATE domain-containing protein [Acidobacteriota bacterium]
MSRAGKPEAPAAAGEIRDGFKFRGGSLALDFPATLAARLRAEPRELLATPHDLGRWLVAAGLATSAPPVTGEELEQARELREALYRLARARVAGQPFPEPDRALLNRWAAGRTPAPCLESDGMSWTREDASTLLSLLARDAVELLGGELGGRIRQCAGEGCALLFVDTSRTGGRKWCSMSGCGNKAKVASFRERRRSG